MGNLDGVFEIFKRAGLFVSVWSLRLVFLPTKKNYTCLNQDRLRAKCFTKIRIAFDFMKCKIISEGTGFLAP